MHHLRWTFSLAALATLAMLGLQAYIWHQGIEQERARFSRSLHNAVYEATEEYMRPLEAEISIAGELATDTIASRSPGIIAIQIGSLNDNFRFRTEDSLFRSMKDELSFLDFDELRKQRHEKVDSMHVRTQIVLSDTLTNRLFVRHIEQCPTCATGVSQLSVENFKPLLERELARLEIDADFDWGVKQLENWLIVDGDVENIDNSSWKFPFLAFPIGGAENAFEMTVSAGKSNNFAAFTMPTISLYFPNESWYLLRNIGPTLISSAILALLVLGCIGYALSVILRQKQLSEIKTDFINNMTHELKTPISTIALACEAMQDAEVAIPPASQRTYLQMISTENDRLAAQVEKVLQMSLLDKKDLGLKKEHVRIHHLLQEIIDSFSLQLQQRKGTISTLLNAQQDIVEGDVMHLRQVFTNLLDNANKYSPQSPEISIETKQLDAGHGKFGIEIAFHDKGLGINSDALRKVFDRFYRVPTGNRHDVKGFGLGLSYVQTMVMAHGGYVRATSNPGQGSSFYLYLPYPNA